MNITQIILIAFGLAVAGGGVVLLFRGAKDRSETPRPFVPLGVTAVGLVIAYHTYSDYATLGAEDVAIMFLFIIALAALLGLRFFIVDRTHLDEQPVLNRQREEPPGDGESGPGGSEG